MSRLQKLLGSFEGYGILADPQNTRPPLTVNCRFNAWQEYDRTTPTLKYIRGFIETPALDAMKMFWQQHRQMELKTEGHTLNIYLLTPSGEFVASQSDLLRQVGGSLERQRE